MKNLTQAEARRIVPRLQWQSLPHGVRITGDLMQASVELSKDDTLIFFAPREMIEKLSRKPKPKPKTPDWESTRANCS